MEAVRCKWFDPHKSDWGWESPESREPPLSMPELGSGPAAHMVPWGLSGVIPEHSCARSSTHLSCYYVNQYLHRKGMNFLKILRRSFSLTKDIDRFTDLRVCEATPGILTLEKG